MNVLDVFTVAFRLLLAFVAGTVVGLERSSRRQVAGVRTHILICEGATLLMLLSIWMSQEYVSDNPGDPGRIAAQVVSGIGFLGAGAILRLGNNVQGLTTAASVWLVAAVGLAIGAGMYVAAGIALVVSFFTLVAVDRISAWLFPPERNKILDVMFHGGMVNTERARKILEKYKVRILTVDFDLNHEEDKLSKIRFLVGIPNNTDFQKLTRELNKIGDVERVELKEKF